jgi:Right handed beta helix region
MARPLAIAVLVSLAAPLTLPDETSAGSRTRWVRSEGQFAAAVSALRHSGGTIVLLPRVYRGTLVVPPRSGRLLRIVGRRGARVERLLLDRTQDVSVGRLRIGPVTGDAWIEAHEARDVLLHNLVVSAAGTRQSATVLLPHSRRVTIRRSLFTHCGDRSPEFANCITLRRVRHLTVENNRFRDCRGCDFIHGRFGTNLTIRNNRLERALPCRMSHHRCGHQDLISIFAGSGLLIENNYFGVYRSGGAQLYLTNNVDHVRIRNNLFVGTDPRVPRYRARVAMVIGSKESVRVPHHVRIVNNTILTGATRVDGYQGSIRMSSIYGRVPLRKRPVLANNVIGLLRVPNHVCSELKASVGNVILRGERCSKSDLVGDPKLDARGRPTGFSRMLIDSGHGLYAPATDITGRRRIRTPDIGAYEFIR